MFYIKYIDSIYFTIILLNPTQRVREIMHLPIMSTGGPLKYIFPCIGNVLYIAYKSSLNPKKTF